MNTHEERLPEKIGKYRILRLIGKGGMGEIFLAEDPLFGREIALKRILEKLIRYPSIRRRFLSEAKIAAQLAHPSIISIYALHEDENEIYYTMPYIEGDALKDILKQTREREKDGEAPHPIGSSIPALIRIFLSVCQAIDYTHAKGFLHRDLKPENIMVGMFGEVMILDWGIAYQIGKEEEEENSIPEGKGSPHDLTKPGKVVGTVNYMAPERALGQPASITTDIYSLGIILYQLLTLRLPFIRPSLQDFRKQMKHEAWVEPQEIAPHRDIPSQLSHIAKKCIHPDSKKRYHSVHEIIKQLESYIEGHPEWIPAKSFEIDTSEDWEFQENVLLAKHMAISRISSVMEWVMLMISKESYSGNTKIETTLELNEGSLGVGFLLCIPQPSERKGLEDGYCLWIGSAKSPGATLFRSNVEVMHIPDAALEVGRPYSIAIEKIENNFHLSIDGTPILNYVSHIPLMGGHLGILFRDANFKMEKIEVSLGSQNVMVNCLSVPDAFLTSKDYGKALAEYRRIARSFKGRAEGREALFRAGITILEQAKGKKTKENREEFYSRALDEFEKLHGTPGAPLEYLGKSLVYRAEGEIEEEIKCLELAIRKYPKHPLIPVVEEHIGLRLHETARSDRLAAYSFILLALLHVPHVLHSKETQHLIENLIADWEPLDFIETPKHFSNDKARAQHIAIQLAFWLSKPTALYEILKHISKDIPEKTVLISNILFSLLEMNYYELVDYILQKQLVSDYKNPSPHLHPDLPATHRAERADSLKQAVKCERIVEQDKDGSNKDMDFCSQTLNENGAQLLDLKKYLEIALLSEGKPVKECLDLFFQKASQPLSDYGLRVLKFLFKKGLTVKEAKHILPFFESAGADFKPLEIWARLLADQKQAAKKLMPEEMTEISSPYYPLQICIQTDESPNLESLLSVKYPPSTALLSYFLKGAIRLKSPWMKEAFLWEKIQLYRALSLYHFCLGKKRKALQFEQMIEKEQKKTQISLNFI